MPADQPPSMVAGLQWPADVARQARSGWVSRDSLAECDGVVVVRSQRPVYPRIGRVIREYRRLARAEAKALPGAGVRGNGRVALEATLSSFVRVIPDLTASGTAVRVVADRRQAESLKRLPVIEGMDDPGAVPVADVSFSNFRMRRMAAAVRHPLGLPRDAAIDGRGLQG